VNTTKIRLQLPSRTRRLTQQDPTQRRDMPQTTWRHTTKFAAWKTFKVIKCFILRQNYSGTLSLWDSNDPVYLRCVHQHQTTLLTTCWRCIKYQLYSTYLKLHSVQPGYNAFL